MRVVISKEKRDKIESIVWAGLSASAIISSMNKGMMTEGHAQANNKVLKMVMDILDNKTKKHKKKS